MIVGTGTDIQDLAPVERALARNDQFLKRVLTPQEQAQAQQLHANGWWNTLAVVGPPRKPLARPGGPGSASKSAFKILRF